MISASETVIEADDYRFETDAWAAYTGRQIIAAAIAVTGLGLLFGGFLWGMGSLSDIIVATPDGVLFVRGGGSPAIFFGPLVSAIGISVLHLFPLLWPSPGRYGDPVEDGDPA